MDKREATLAGSLPFFFYGLAAELWSAGRVGGGSVVGGSVAGPGVAAAYGSGVAGGSVSRVACGVAMAGVSAARSAARYSWVACHHAVCCLVRVASLVLGSEVVMPEKVRIAFAPLDIE